MIEKNSNHQAGTIIQLSTPRAISAIHVIRLSGSKAKDFLQSHSKVKRIEPRKVYYSSFYDGKKVIDKVILFFFPSPNSYTGEDMAEIQCHGSLLIVEEILKVALKEDLVLSSPGEFTKRAFLNGKLTLHQSEAIDVLIKAKSEHLKQNALSILEEKVGFKFSQIKIEILNILAEFESAIEFPEEGEISTKNRQEHFRRYLKRLETIENYFSSLVTNYQKGMKLEEGLKIAIGGRPNVGKSTLMNALLRQDRVLVSEVKGTTRDYVKEQIHLGGFCILFYDTAGIRETKDQIESAGVEKSKTLLSQCDLQLFLISTLECVETLRHQIERKNPSLIFLNKIDLLSSKQIASIEESLNREGLILNGKISLMETKSVAIIEQAILTTIVDKFKLPNTETLSLLNERQKIISQRILKKIEELVKLLKSGETEEILSEEFSLLNSELDELNLSASREEVFDHLFKQFCIGK